jgi:pimeloyl-ACP methyl ester carboxylesterase
LCGLSGLSERQRRGVKVRERIVEANGVGLCTEPFGDPANPPILLIMGTGASMLWWEEGFCRLLANGGRFVSRDVRRARDFAARQNHDLLTEGETLTGTLSPIDAPTLVIHGTADPMFPIEHGRALVREIPDARLLALKGAGHGVQPTDWETIVGAILEHTRARGAAG